MELTDSDFLGDTAPGPRHHRRVLRLTWTSRIFAPESYDGFCAGPFGIHHPARQGVPPSNLFEVTNDPDPWTEEMLAEMGERLWAQEGDVQVTGRFFPPAGEVKTAHPQATARTERVASLRCRHLFIASETHMLEVLCGDLPGWEVVTLE
ncbi:hypothetical protein [Deinococcus gobiensis]|nr:hypothetical protein [Deinococcus gobiensis]